MTDLKTPAAQPKAKTAATARQRSWKRPWTYVRRPSWPVLRLVVLALAVGLCAWSVVAYWQSGPDERAAEFAKTRDRVAAAARTEIAALNTIDPLRPEPGLRAWLDATTGALHTELVRNTAENRRKLTQSGLATEGVVTDLAVTDLDDRAGIAQVIATVDIKATKTSGAAGGTDRKRFTATLARTGGGWKLKSLTAIPVGTG